MKTLEKAKTVEGVDRPMYTVPELAARLRSSERQAWEWVSTGQIASVKIGRLRRVTHEAVLDFINRSAA